MTNAPWTSRGRVLLCACLTISLVPAPVAGAAGPTADTLLQRDAHRKQALAPARKELARKRAERARIAAGGKPTVKPPADRKDKAPADAAAARAAAEAPAKPKAEPKPKAKAGAKDKGAAKPAKDATTKAPPVGDYEESTPLDLPVNVEAGPSRADTGGGSIGRLVFSLLLVVGLIYGLTAALRRMRNGAIGGGGRATSGLKAVASIPLGPNRSIHLVRAGQEYLLVGAAEHGVVPLRTYTEDEARAAGLLDLDAKRAATAATSAAAVAEAQGEAPKAKPWDGVNLSTLVDDLRSRTVRR